MEAGPRALSAPQVTKCTNQQAWFLWQQLLYCASYRFCSPTTAVAPVALRSQCLASRSQKSCYPIDLESLCLQQLPQLLVACASKQAPGQLLPEGLNPPCSTIVLSKWSPCLGKQAPEHPLSEGFVFLWLQQLLWLFEASTWQAGPRTPSAHAPTQVDPRASVALWAPDNSSPPALLPPQAPSTCYSVLRAHCHNTSEPQAPCFAILLVPGNVPPVSAPLTTKPPVGELLVPCQRAGTQLLHWMLICHSVSARKSASLRNKKAQGFPMCLTMGKPPFLH
jgi:hypothetical protein